MASVLFPNVALSFYSIHCYNDKDIYFLIFTEGLCFPGYFSPCNYHRVYSNIFIDIFNGKWLAVHLRLLYKFPRNCTYEGKEKIFLRLSTDMDRREHNVQRFVIN